MSFVHLHCHSEFSLLDGANRIKDLVRKTAEFEQPALAITDHGCMFGAWEFQEIAKKNNIKPIIGMEAYVSTGSRWDRERKRGERNYYHLVLLAQNLEGYRNLSKLSSIGYTEGFYQKPRIDREVIEKYSNGIIVSSACLAGEVAQHLLEDRWQEAEEAAAWYANTFPDRYYLEVQAHDSPGQDTLNTKIFQLAEKTGIKVIATNDAHFLTADDHTAHDCLLCIGLGKEYDDPNRMKYDKGLYFKNHQEIQERFPDRPDVLLNTLEIADQVDITFPKKYYVPTFPLPEDVFDEASLLKIWVWEGAKERYAPDAENIEEYLSKHRPDVVERIKFELDVIIKTGYSGYFLITADFIKWARDHDIPVGPGRGSAAGSIVAYCTGITNLCPIKFELLFERFLNPDRVSMPDIDIDFCFERRTEVIDYVREKYGKNAVGQIITFGTMKSRAAVKDVGRTLGFPPSETDFLAKLIPNTGTEAKTVKEAITEVDAVAEKYDNDPRYRELLDLAIRLEGLSRHSSVHAAGIVIAPGPLDEYVPICTQKDKSAAKGESEDRTIVTQYTMNPLERAGMLKFDFLGLKTLTVIDDAVKTIVSRHDSLRHPKTGEEYKTIDDIPLDDPAVFEMLARGGTAGVFQFESQLATHRLKQMKADCFEDLIATNALLRPGPLDMGMDMTYIRRKLGTEEVRYAHPALQDVLKPTYGVIVYQEQVMRIAQTLAGYTLAQADVLRKAVGKKDAELIRKEIGTFIEKGIANGHDENIIKSLGEQIEAFGRYGFNRSHSAAYSLIAYQTAWLKAHYPAEFMAALLSSVVDKADDVVNYVNECRELGKYISGIESGINVLPPHINESGWKFTVSEDGKGIRFGLGAIRGIGENSVNSIINERAEEPFESLFNFLCRIDHRSCNKRILESLIKAGALDGFAPNGRAQLLGAIEPTMAAAQTHQKDAASSQENMFDALLSNGNECNTSIKEPPLPDIDAWTLGQKLTEEKEILGFFISGHPLDPFRDEVLAFETVAHTGNRTENVGKRVEIASLITKVETKFTKKDKTEYGIITIEDFQGSARVMAFSDVWKKTKELAFEDAPVLLTGNVSNKERDKEDPTIFLESITPLQNVRQDRNMAIEISLDTDSVEPRLIAEGKSVMARYPGQGSLYTKFGDNLLKSKTIKIDPTPELIKELRGIFGKENVTLSKATR
jgi:DNA polymerase III subunit alpha